MVSFSAPQMGRGLLQQAPSKGSFCRFYPRKSKGPGRKTLNFLPTSTNPRLIICQPLSADIIAVKWGVGRKWRQALEVILSPHLKVREVTGCGDTRL